MIRPGDEWGELTDATPDVIVRGDDTALAAVAVAHSESIPLVRFLPDGSELARAVGVTSPTEGSEPRGIALPVDAIVTEGGTAMNLVVLGTAPASLHVWHRSHRLTVTVDGRAVHEGRATAVVVANGQFSGAADLVPRGHPGDGRLEVQVYGLRPGERSAMRRRLGTGTHVPHPRIVTASGRSVRVDGVGHPWPVTLDGRPVGRFPGLTATVRHPALRLLI